MAYTGNPAGNPVDAVRYRLADTGDDPLLSDAEITYEIGLQTPLNGGDPLIVAAFCAETIAARYASEVSISADGVTYSGEQLQEKYASLALDLRARYRLMRQQQGGGPIAEGTSIYSSHQPGTKRPTFVIAQDDNPWAGAQRGRANNNVFALGDEGDLGLDGDDL